MLNEFMISQTDIRLISRSADNTSGSINAQKCRFEFDETWDDYRGRIAYFGPDYDRMKPVLLIAEVESSTQYYCFVPSEVLAAAGAEGTLYLCVSGATGEGVGLRTKMYRYPLLNSGQVEMFLTQAEQQSFLTSVENALALFEGKTIQSAAINNSGELLITLADGTVMNLGVVKGDDAKQIAALGESLAQGSVGNLKVDFNDGSSYVSDLKIKARLNTGPGGQPQSYDLQQLAEHLKIVQLTTDRSGTGLVLQFADGSTYESPIAVGAYLPTGPGGNNNNYTLQELAAFLYQKILEKAQKGDTGATGADGKSAYEIAQENGFEGTEQQWLASLVGATGAQGPKGDTGATGAKGDKGDKGDTGATGPAGSDAKQIASFYAATEPPIYGKLGVIFNDNTSLRSDLKIKAKLGTTGYDMQELAEYLNGKVIASVIVDSTPGNNQGKLLFTCNDGTCFYANTKLLAVMPTGTNGANELYNMQDLATFFYAKQLSAISFVSGGPNSGKIQALFNDGTSIMTDSALTALLPTGPAGNNAGYTLQQLATFLYGKITALESRVAELEALTRVTVNGTSYTYKLDYQNNKPVLVLTEVQA